MGGEKVCVPYLQNPVNGAVGLNVSGLLRYTKSAGRVWFV